MAHLDFKGRVFVENLHLAVPFHEWKAVRSKGLSKKPSLDDNLIIEGDNLAALKALLPHYHGKVKCIYIDPPYNTGNEGWKYNDRVNSPMMKDWLGKVVDREDLTRHDKWCCMMLPRLRLLRELMRDDGVIFVSCDYNESARLRMLMDDVYGEDNFLADIAWEKRYTRSNNAKLFYSLKDTIIAYRRSDVLQLMREPRTEKSDRGYANPDDDANGPWITSSYVNPATKAERPNLVYPIHNPFTQCDIRHPTHAWKYSPDTHAQHVRSNRLWWGRDGTARYPRLKVYQRDDGLVPTDVWNYEDSGTTDDAGQTIKEIFGSLVFDTPKPVALLSRILKLAAQDRDSIVLDSFAGSGTTAHAVLALNRDDGGHRRFVLVESEDYVDRITAERVRRVVKGVPKSKDATLREGLGGTFSYFKLGKPMRKEAMLHPTELPTYERLAAYVFFTATREEFDASKVNRDRWFIGRSRRHEVFLIYTDDFEELKDLALTANMARKLSRSQRPKLVFAPTKYVDRETLHRHGITFHQLPFEIYETVDRLSR